MDSGLIHGPPQAPSSSPAAGGHPHLSPSHAQPPSGRFHRPRRGGPGWSTHRSGATPCFRNIISRRYGTFVTTDEAILIDTSPLTEVHTSFGFLSFSLVSFSVPRAHWGHHLTLQYRVSLGSSELCWFLRLSMFFMTFDSFEA